RQLVARHAPRSLGRAAATLPAHALASLTHRRHPAGISSPMPRSTRLLFAFAVLALVSGAFAADNYTLGPDSLPQPGVPQGNVTQHSWKSALYPGTTRDYWVYVPAQYDDSQPACVMVFQ